MKVYVVPYGKDTKVYTSREAAEKARDRIAYNIEMSGSNNPTPPVIETDTLDESLNESTDSTKKFLVDFIDKTYFNGSMDEDTLKYIASETKANPLSEDAFESGFWDSLEYADEDMGDKEFNDMMDDEELCKFINNYFVSKVEELYGPVEAAEVDDDWFDESLKEANQRVNNSVNKIYEKLQEDSFEPSVELSKLYKED